MAKASENVFPKVQFSEEAAPGTPSAGQAVIYVKSDGKIYLKDDAGTETDLTAAGASSPLTTKGDVYVYGSSDDRLPVGTNDHVLTADSAQALGVKWAPAAGSTAEWVENALLRTNQPADAADVYWEGSDYSGSFTQYTGTGAQTITEQNGVLSILQTSANSSDNVAAALTAHSFSLGDTFAVPVRAMSVDVDTLYMGVVITDGTASGSNAIGATIQSTNDRWNTYTRSGTLGSFGSVDTARTIRAIDPIMLAIEYDASNSFKMFASSDGVSWTDLGHAAVAKTMTPTHVGVVWYSTAGDTAFTFGPLLKTA